MRLNLSSLILIVLIAAALMFVLAPWFAFRSMRDAAKTEDLPALTQLVDYNAVREDLSAQMSGAPAPQTPPPDMWRDPIGALKHAFTPPPPASPKANEYVNPKALAALAEGELPGAPPPAKGKEPFPMIAFWGPDRCRITVEDPAVKGRKTEFTFQRKGIFTWKLTRIVLPKPAPQAQPA